MKYLIKARVFLHKYASDIGALANVLTFFAILIAIAALFYQWKAYKDAVEGTAIESIRVERELELDKSQLESLKLLNETLVKQQQILKEQISILASLQRYQVESDIESTTSEVAAAIRTRLPKLLRNVTLDLASGHLDVGAQRNKLREIEEIYIGAVDCLDNGSCTGESIINKDNCFAQEIGYLYKNRVWKNEEIREGFHLDDIFVAAQKFLCKCEKNGLVNPFFEVCE